MTIFVNPMAAGGRGLKKWETIHRTIAMRSGDFALRFIEGAESFHRDVAEALEAGERDFVAAGGDGTLNVLLNELLLRASGADSQNLRIGSIGLGSSNDFHKPYRSESMIDHIPTAVDFSTARFRDVGCLTYETDGKSLTKYFLSNASVGATAEANVLFNHPTAILRRLKRVSTGTAVFYAALATIIRFRNLPLRLDSGNRRESCAPVSNLAVIKNKHFSGSLHYNRQPGYDDGQLFYFLSTGMTRLELFKLFVACSNGSSDRIANLEQWTDSRACLDAREPFAVEYDGEVLMTRSVEFTILQRFLKVCIC